MTRRRLLLLLARPALVIAAYLLLREYADRARSLEAVLGLSHGDPAWQAGVAALVILLRVAAYGVTGGALLALPLEAWLRARAARANTGGGAGPSA